MTWLKNLEEKCRFSDHVIKEGYEINHEKINILEETEILKVAISKNTLKVVINGRNDSIYKLFPPTSAYKSIRQLFKLNSRRNFNNRPMLLRMFFA